MLFEKDAFDQATSIPARTAELPAAVQAEAAPRAPVSAAEPVYVHDPDEARMVAKIVIGLLSVVGLVGISVVIWGYPALITAAKVGAFLGLSWVLYSTRDRIVDGGFGKRPH